MTRENKNLICEMGESAYFGEVGILFTKVRTVYIRAKGEVKLLGIRKEKLELLLHSYPNYKEFLMKVAR